MAIGIGANTAIFSLLYQVLLRPLPATPKSSPAAGVVLPGASILACYLPARGSTRVAPMAALREG